MSYVEERIEVVRDAIAPMRRPSCRLPFNGTLSADELRMLQQGRWRDGSDYEELLADLHAPGVTA